MALVVSVSLTQAQETAVPETITWWRPLEKAADLLEQRYARPVTEEDPVWLWRGDTFVLAGSEQGGEVLALTRRTLVMPAEEAPASVARAARMVLSAYDSQNPGVARYRVLESRAGTHIVPDQIRNESGKLAPAVSLLDTRITVPIARRRASDHVIALCAAVSKAAGWKLACGDGYLNMEFAANGYLIPNLAAGWSEQVQKYISFDWGTQVATARDALIDLLDRSSTTMTWRLYCMPSASPRNETCLLQIRPLQIGPDKIVRLDRCIIDPADTLAVMSAHVAQGTSGRGLAFLRAEKGLQEPALTIRSIQVSLVERVGPFLRCRRG